MCHQLLGGATLSGCCWSVPASRSFLPGTADSSSRTVAVWAVHRLAYYYFLSLLHQRTLTIFGLCVVIDSKVGLFSSLLSQRLSLLPNESKHGRLSFPSRTHAPKYSSGKQQLIITLHFCFSVCCQMAGIIFTTMDDPCNVDCNNVHPLVCPLCHEQYRSPCLLDCYHIFCACCLRGRTHDNRLSCPLCG